MMTRLLLRQGSFLLPDKFQAAASGFLAPMAESAAVAPWSLDPPGFPPPLLSSKALRYLIHSLGQSLSIPRQQPTQPSNSVLILIVSAIGGNGTKSLRHSKDER